MIENEIKEVIYQLNYAINKIRYYEMKDMVIHLEYEIFNYLVSLSDKYYTIKSKDEMRVYRGIRVEPFKEYYEDLYGTRYETNFLIKEYEIINYNDLTKYIDIMEKLGYKVTGYSVESVLKLISFDISNYYVYIETFKQIKRILNDVLSTTNTQ